MVAGLLGLIAASLFAGAAFYINIAEHPARLRLDNKAMLAQWKPSYQRGLVMQSLLAIAGFAAGMLAWYQSDDWRWALGAFVMLSNWPFTLLVIMPLNKRLMEWPNDKADDEVRAMMQQWGLLHGCRTGFGALAVVIFLWSAAV